MKNHLIKLLIISIFVLLLSSCGGKLGYGIVLWSPDELTIPTGSSVKVLSESSIRDSYMIQLEDNKQKMEIAKWRVSIFEKADQRNEALSSYNQWMNHFARCERRGLPMRSTPEINEANTVYKLRDGQEVKIIGRQEEETTISNLSGYWYQLLTEDGVLGWCFDYYLQVYSLGEDDELVIENKQVATDELLEQLYDTYFYPTYYDDMISQKRIDLSIMRPDYYFYINSENKTLTFRSHEREVITSYERAELTGYHKYTFIGASITIEAYNENILSLQYSYEGKDYKEGMVRLNSPIEEIIQNEIDKRATLAEEFMQKGPYFTSDTYGELQYIDGNRFFWKDKSILISRNILSSQAGNEGTISFDRFPDRSLRSSYDGAIRLRFSKGEEITFLYIWKDQGVRFLYIPESNIDKGVIESDQYLNPLQIFFKFSSGEE